jgi:hypothetical protein
MIRDFFNTVVSTAQVLLLHTGFSVALLFNDDVSAAEVIQLQMDEKLTENINR